MCNLTTIAKRMNAVLAVSILTVSLFGQIPNQGASPGAIPGPNPGLNQKKAPEVRVVDDKISIQAEAVPLGQLVRLLDLATGMTSKVSSDVANRSVFVRFSDLDLNSAVRKIFEGQSLDYVVLSGQGIQVRGPSEAVPTTSGSSVAASSFTQPPVQDLPFNNGPPIPNANVPNVPNPGVPNPTAGAPQGNPQNPAIPVVPAARPNTAQPNAPVTAPGAIPMYTPPAPAAGGTGSPAGPGPGAPGGATPPPLGNGALPVFNPTAR